MMMQRVPAPEKRSFCQNEQRKSSMFAPRGFASRNEDKDLDGRRQASPYSDFSLADVSLFSPVQPKLAGEEAASEHGHVDGASSQCKWGLNVPRFKPVQAKL